MENNRKIRKAKKAVLLLLSIFLLSVVIRWTLKFFQNMGRSKINKDKVEANNKEYLKLYLAKKINPKPRHVQTYSSLLSYGHVEVTNEINMCFVSPQI